MGLITVNNVKISGVVSIVPKEELNNLENTIFETQEVAEKFISLTGIKSKRHAAEGVLTSDLCFQAAEKLISDLRWNKEEIDVLIMVTQTPDYLAPNTSIILQDRLQLSKKTICFDVPLGCSGYVYGLSILSSMLSSGHLKKGILLAGDTLTKQCSHLDKSTFPLFGDAGSATAVECVEGSKLHFSLWSDGSGYRSIIVPAGGYRNPVSEKSFEMINDDGNVRSAVNTFMDGTEVFSFGISEVPKEIAQFLSYFELTQSDIDYALFHQANRFMNEMIRKKAGFKKEQVPYSLTAYGNTSSATIPLTFSMLGDDVKGKKFLACGFGVGLSIGTMYFETDNSIINELIEYE